MKNKNSRRDFIKKSALAAGSFYIVPRHVLGKGFKAPSDKLNLAAIGAGGKGRSDIMNAWNKGSENVVALCDIDLNQAEAAMKKFPKAKVYRDFREMLDNQKDIDAVTISTPDHNHGVAAMSAMQKGLHVYVQKPLTHNIYEARMLTEGARKYKIVSQMGNQGASNPGQQQMIAWFGQGLIGKVDAAHIWTNRPVWPQGIPVPSEKMPLPDTISAKNWDTWIGPAKEVDYHPLYHPFKWRGWWDFGTGALGDMGCHLIDPAFRVLQLGYPTEVECSVGQIFLKDWNPEYIPEGCPPSSSVKVQFGGTAVNDKPIAMYWSDGGIRPFHPNIIPADHPLGDDDSSNGVMLIGEKGVMTCGTYGANPKIYLNSGDILEMPKGYDGGLKNHKMTEYGHHLSWIEAIKGGFGSKEHKALTSSFDYSGPLTETVIMGNLAIRSYQESTSGSGRAAKYEGRKKLLWDGENMKVTNYDEANKFVSRKYRDGWKLI
ncbi:MAG: putative dehydrogenase [Arcticibacterium sp.]|jgi:predicted dehydrogenase